MRYGDRSAGYYVYLLYHTYILLRLPPTKGRWPGSGTEVAALHEYKQASSQLYPKLERNSTS